MDILDDLELDALTELVNIGVSRAATSLSQIVSDEIRLSVPSVDIVAQEHAVLLLAAGTRDRFIGVGIGFTGSFSGCSLLIFPEANSRELVLSVLDKSLTPEEVKELEPDALKEIGNIVLISCLSVISNTLGASLKMDLPEIRNGTADEILSQDGQTQGMVIFVYVNFNFHKRNIKGYIAIALSSLTINALKEMASIYIERAIG